MFAASPEEHAEQCVHRTGRGREGRAEKRKRQKKKKKGAKKKKKLTHKMEGELFFHFLKYRT